MEINVTNNCKAFTSLEQSKKLAEILPVESADMWWAERYVGKVMLNGQYVVDDKVPLYYPCLVQPSKGNYSQDIVRDIPCWSLAALLEYLRKVDLFPKIINADDYVLMDIDFYDEDDGKVLHPVHFIRAEGDSIIDACYELILKLHEVKML